MFMLVVQSTVNFIAQNNNIVLGEHFAEKKIIDTIVNRNLKPSTRYIHTYVMHLFRYT